MMNSSLTNRQIEDILDDDIVELQKKENNICPTCGSSNFIEDYTKGLVFCNCGQVIETSIFDNGMERRNHDGDENDNTRSGMVHNRLLPQSSLGTTVTAKGRLKQLHIWNAMPYKERSDNILFKKIHAVCVARGISKRVGDDAKILCKRVSGTVHKTGKNKGKPVITRGFNRSGIVAGCLFIACRRNDETRSIKEIAFYFEISERDVNKGIRSLLAILDDDSIVRDIGTSKVIHFIKRKCDELHIINKYADTARTIANNIDKLNIASNHTTYSLAAASIMLMADIYSLNSITKKKLSESFCGLSEVTIGKTFNQIKNLRIILTDNAKVDEICKEITKQRNKRVITKAVYDQMVRFGVDTSKYILEGHEEEYDESALYRHEPTRYEMLTFEQVEDITDYGHTKKKITFDGIENDTTSRDSENSYDDLESMLHDVNVTMKELKYMDILNDDAIDVIQNINIKLNIVQMYIEQWCRDVGISPYF
jgi:transcription initiation factor TFIIB